MSNRRSRRRVDQRTQLAQGTPHWNWRTLPVWLALTGGFVVGWYVAAIGARASMDPWAWWVLYIVLAGFSFGLSRIISRFTARIVARRRLRNERKQERILSEPPTRRSR